MKRRNNSRNNVLLAFFISIIVIYSAVLSGTVISGRNENNENATKKYPESGRFGVFQEREITQP